MSTAIITKMEADAGSEALPTMKRLWAITPGPDQIEFRQWLKSSGSAGQGAS